jgi:hypothetical protein
VRKFSLEHVETLLAGHKYAEAGSYVKKYAGDFGDAGNDVAAKVERERDKALVDVAYKSLAGKKPQEAIAFAVSPEGQKAFGLSAGQGGEVASMLYANWNHLKAIEKQAREEHINKIATEAFDLAFGSDERSSDPVAALKLVRESNLDGFAKARAIKLIQSGNLGKTQNDPLMARELINGIIDGKTSEADIRLMTLTGGINSETQADLLQFLKAKDGGAKEALELWKNAVDKSFDKSLYGIKSLVQAQAWAKAMIEGEKIILQKFKEDGTDKALAWIVSKEAAAFLNNTAPSMEDYLKVLRAGFQAGALEQETPPAASSGSVANFDGTSPEASLRQPGESLGAWLQRMKIQLLRGGQ